jgi:chromosome condensin MukBEF complex kleisin-like MukF subunit
MTDYKNELEQILNRLMISANNHRGNAFLLNSDHRKALSSLEALLSQHSKKRELEARRDELQALNRDIFGDLVTSREIKNTITKRLGRIHKLTNGEGDKNE